MIAPTALPVGHLDRAQIPALLPFAWNSTITISHLESSFQEQSARLAEAFVLRLLATDTPGSVQVMFLEAQLSPQYAALKRVLARTGKTYGQRAHDPRSFASILTQLYSQAQERSAQLAEADAPDWWSYRQAVPRAGEHILLLLTGMEQLQAYDGSLAHLEALCQEGPRVGIIPIVLHSPSGIAALPDLARQGIERLWHGLSVLAHRFHWDIHGRLESNRDPEHWRQFSVHRLCPGHQPKTLSAWAEELIVRQASRITISIDQDFLRVPIGHDGGVEVSFRLGEAANSFHALIGGMSGMGKSTLLDTLILGACQRYSPAQLQLTLLDLKNGATFSSYPGLAHVHRYHGCLGFDEGVLLLLQEVFAERARRQQVFQDEARRVGRRINKFSDYNRHAPTPLPYWLVIIEEFEAFFGALEPALIAKRKAAISILQDIARQCRSEGIGLLLCTQSYVGVMGEMGASAMGQFGVRIAFHVDDQRQSASILGVGNTAATDLPERTAIIKSGQGSRETFQTIDIIHTPNFDEALDALKQQHPGHCQPLNLHPSTEPSTVSKSSTVEPDYISDCGFPP